MEKDQLINCDVHDCEHCNCSMNLCNLKSIKVCNSNGEGQKETTMCNSYETKKE